VSRPRSIVVAAVVLGVAAVVLGGCAHSNGASPVTSPGVQVAAPSPPPARPLAIQDVMPDFWQWRRAVQGQSLEAQADAFMADFAPRFPHIYNRHVIGKLFAGPDAARASLVKYFTELPAHEEAIRSASATLPRELVQQAESPNRLRDPLSFVIARDRTLSDESGARESVGLSIRVARGHFWSRHGRSAESTAASPEARPRQASATRTLAASASPVGRSGSDHRARGRGRGDGGDRPSSPRRRVVRQGVAAPDGDAPEAQHLAGSDA
jgi:hypothetical protein